MRPYCISALGTIIVAAVFCAQAHALVEYHAGVYTSYEYTDNYLGTSDDEESESIYQVGPSAQVIYTSGTTRLDLSGRVARSYHAEFDEDDGTDALFTSRLSTTTQRDQVLLSYNYTQTERSAVLTDVRGTSRIHTGTLDYTRALTQALSTSLGYTYYWENNPSPDEDLVTNAVRGSLTYQISQLTRLNVTAGYDANDYTSPSGAEVTGDTTGDTWVARSTVGVERYLSPLMTVGTSGEYEHTAQKEDDDLPDSDIVRAFLSWGYQVTPQTHVLLSGGYNWLNMESEDQESTYAARAEVTYRTQYDTFTLRASREYIPEFTTDEYGVYESLRASLAWDKALLRELNLSSTITYEERKPVSGDELTMEEGDETDFSGRVSLAWNPLRYLFITPSYEHIERRQEDLDTEKENRYRVVVEVRY